MAWPAQHLRRESDAQFTSVASHLEATLSTRTTPPASEEKSITSPSSVGDERSKKVVAVVCVLIVAEPKTRQLGAEVHIPNPLEQAEIMLSRPPERAVCCYARDQIKFRLFFSFLTQFSDLKKFALHYSWLLCGSANGNLCQHWAMLPIADCYYTLVRSFRRTT